MQNISKRLIVAIIVLIIAIVVGGWFWYTKQKMTVSPIEGEIKTIYTIPGQNVSDGQSAEMAVSQGNELDSINDIIDGEYTFSPVDTSKWQTYRNEAMGFEIKIPKDWYVNDLSKSEDASTAKYYSGNEQFGVCFGQKGKEYWYEGGKEDALCLYIYQNKNISSTPLNYREAMLKRKQGYGDKIFTTTIDKYPAVVLDGGFGLSADIFRENSRVSLSYGLIGYPEVRAAYPNILKSMKFFR